MSNEEGTAVDHFDPKHPDYRRYYTKADVESHDTFDNCWVSFFNKVYDLTSLIQQNSDSELSKPIIKRVNRDTLAPTGLNHAPCNYWANLCDIIPYPINRSYH